jgi:pimeloyl-ACP methyl ester carboxylesterase
MGAKHEPQERNHLASDVSKAFGPMSWAAEYWIDAAQRTVLFWDTLRQRGNQYHEHRAETAPHVLDYDVELIVDGRTLARPVNYALVRVTPPVDVTLDDRRRPFVVVDPRAGHGPGIGGFKADSEIGVAMKAGHPCYFIGFLPDPMPGQTIEDIAQAEASFLEMVAELHPQAEGKPCVIGNCQAGWAIMMLAAIRPELFGALIIAGSPLSYWAGVRGENPMRYSGGLLGGSWLTALMSDLGQGKFDGAWLVQNFESLNPSNTLWTKQYNLYSKIDTEAPRYLEFERWWGGHVELNADEIQFIVDELFIGNNLAAGRITTSDGTAIDLRNIRVPIVVFCSRGDNITPPAQALGWVLDLYDSVDDIRSYGQTIVYTVHADVGHLGIFVSGGVARKEHDEFSSNIDLIDTLPPGLYEAVFAPKDKAEDRADLVSGDWVMRCEARTLDDIRALGGAGDEHLFEAAAQVSKANLSFYRTFMQPTVRALAKTMPEHLLRDSHPLRLQYAMFSDKNPLMAWVKPLADVVEQNRVPATSDNPLMRAQELASKQIVAGLDRWRDRRDAWSERMFLSVYGAPLVQAMAGAGDGERPPRKAGRSALHGELVRMRIADLKSRVGEGGLQEALIRCLIYIGKPRGGVDERGFEMIRDIRRTHEEEALSLADFKKLVREQFFMLLLDEKNAIAAVPSLLPDDQDIRAKAFDLLTQVLQSSGPISGETKDRWEEISRLLGLEAPARQRAATDVAKAS